MGWSRDRSKRAGGQQVGTSRHGARRLIGARLAATSKGFVPGDEDRIDQVVEYDPAPCTVGRSKMLAGEAARRVVRERRTAVDRAADTMTAEQRDDRIRELEDRVELLGFDAKAWPSQRQEIAEERQEAVDELTALKPRTKPAPWQLQLGPGGRGLGTVATITAAGNAVLDRLLPKERAA